MYFKLCTWKSAPELQNGAWRTSVGYPPMEKQQTHLILWSPEANGTLRCVVMMLYESLVLMWLWVIWMS